MVFNETTNCDCIFLSKQGRLLHMLCLVFTFRYLKVHDDIDVDALVTELQSLKNISSSFISDAFETVRDVSKPVTPL